MSTSAQHSNPSGKRPLEDVSSPSRNDQPDAKRPALDKLARDEEELKPELVRSEEDVIDSKDNILESNGDSIPAGAADATNESNGAFKANGETRVKTESHDDTIVPDAPETKPIMSTASNMAQVPAPNLSAIHDETLNIHVRAVISSPEAATVIGKGGENVSKIRQMSGAKCTVSDYQKGAVERILTVSGVVDAVAKAFGLIIRTLNNEALEAASDVNSKTYPLRLLIPHVLIGSIIGKGGARIKEIQEASGARLNASESCLPLSTERSLVIMGVADAVHIATYYVSTTLMEQLNERFGGPAASAYATRSGGPANAVPGGLQVIPYVPQSSAGNYGHRDNYNRRHHESRSHTQHQPYPQQPYGHQQAQANAAMMSYGQHAAGAGYGPGPVQPHHGGHVGPGPQPHVGPHGQPLPAQGMAGGPLTQQIYIPNDMVGAIIGKGGQKINEIRQVSGSVIKINEPQDNSNERLVTITGTEECNRMALYMLYSRLESEKHRI